MSDFSKNFDEIQKEYEHRNIKAELAAVIETITASDVIMRRLQMDIGITVTRFTPKLHHLKKGKTTRYDIL